MNEEREKKRKGESERERRREGGRQGGRIKEKQNLCQKKYPVERSFKVAEE